MPNDPNISVPVGSSTSIRTVTEHKDVGVSFGSGFPGTTQHIQVVTVGFHDGTSVTHDIVSSANPMPVTFPTASSDAYDRIKELSDGITFSGGVTSMKILFDTSQTLAFSGSIENVGITTNYDFAQMFVYGVPGATGVHVHGVTNGIAVGVTGQVAVIGNSSLAPVIVGGTAGSGHVGVTGQVALAAPAAGSIPVAGTAGSGFVGVTGGVFVTSMGVGTTAMPVTGGVFVTGLGQGTTAMPVLATPPSGITSGFTSGDLRGIRAFGTHGLSSGVRIMAKSVGSGTGTFCYVGYGSSLPGTTNEMFPLREFESVFVEIDNMDKIAIASDHSSVEIRYIGT